MSKLVWDQVGERLYETGVDRGVFYPITPPFPFWPDYDTSLSPYGIGVAWNGLSSVSESPSGAEASAVYADNIKYLNLMSAEDFSATIEAYTYPDEFAECDGSASIATGVSIGQQKRKMFGFSYRTKIGNDVDGDEYGYKIHLVYGCLASPSEKSRNTINDSPEAITFSWSVNTTPVEVTGFRPTSHLEIDSTKADPAKLAQLESFIYGSNGIIDHGHIVGVRNPRLPLPNKVVEIVGQSI